MIALSLVGGALVVMLATGTDSQAPLTAAALAGAGPGIASGLRFVTATMVAENSPFAQSEQYDRSGRGRLRAMLGDAGWGLLAMAVAGLATTAVLAGQLADAAGAIIAIPLLWLLGYLPGAVVGLILSIAIGMPLQLARRRAQGYRGKNDFVYLVVAALFPLLIAGFITAFLAVDIADDAPGRKRLGAIIWVLFGGSNEYVSLVDGPLVWVARICLLLALALLATIIVSSVRAAKAQARDRA